MVIRHLNPVYYSILFLAFLCETGSAQSHENSAGLFDSDEVLTHPAFRKYS